MRHAARVHVSFVAGLFVAVMLHGIPADAADEFAPATPHGKIAGCPRGAFPDISRKIGRVECWKCPKGYNRTVPFFAIDGDHACEGPREFKRARPGAKATQGPVPLLMTKCPEGQFWDPNPNGTCYSCPDGFERTVFPITPITSRQACSRPAYTSAAQSPDAGCPEGTFLDFGRGDCWSCPAFAGYRTVNPVDGAKACTNTVANILAVDSTAMCTQFLTALREGEEGANRLMTSLAQTVEPVMQPVQGLMGTFNQQIATPAELDRLVDRLAEGLRPHGPMIDELQRISNQMEKNRIGFQALLLNPTVMCEGGLDALDQELIALGLRPDARAGKSGWMDDLLIGKAHAATKGTYVSVFLSFVLPLPPAMPVPNSLVLMGITNFAGDGGFYWSLGRSWSTELRPSKLLEMLKGVSISGGMHVFPNTDSDDFLGINALALEFSFGPTGEKRETLLRKLGAKQWLVPDNFIVSVDPLFWEGKTFPLGFGFSWTRARQEPGQISSASPSGTVPIAVPPTPRPSRTFAETSSSASPSGTVTIPTPRQNMLDVNFSVDFTAPLRPPWQ